MEATPVNDTGTNQPDGATGNDETKEPTVAPTHEQEIVRLRDECAQLEQQLQRQLADAANVRRRAQQEFDEQKRRVLAGLTQELLPALDTFAMALAAFDQGNADPKTLVEGVRMTRMLLASALERHGLQEIQAEGLPFDPQRHEAVTTEATAGVQEGHVVRVLQAGYLLGDRVVRYSRVVVAGPTPNG
ncbi:MAG: nucleotide exchange factor GrpE [Planctomycetes bacterium]|nr:nucleotide exchange factor GrpE [Planctomycetota bacterium]